MTGCVCVKEDEVDLQGRSVLISCMAVLKRSWSPQFFWKRRQKFLVGRKGEKPFLVAEHMKEQASSAAHENKGGRHPLYVFAQQSFDQFRIVQLGDVLFVPDSLHRGRGVHCGWMGMALVIRTRPQSSESH